MSKKEKAPERVTDQTQDPATTADLAPELADDSQVLDTEGPAPEAVYVFTTSGTHGIGTKRIQLNEGEIAEGLSPEEQADLLARGLIKNIV